MGAARHAATAGPRPFPPRSAGALASALQTPFASRAATLLVLPAATAAIAFRRSTYHGGSLEAVLLRWNPDSGLFDCETAVTLQLGDSWPPAGGPAGLPPLLGWGASPRSDALLRLARGVPLWDCGRAFVCTTNQATLEALLDNRRAAAWRDAAEHSGEAYIVKGRLGGLFASVEGFEGNTPGLRAALDRAAATVALF